MSELVTVVE